jgi:predicted regulator of Ras-like GTPase activity (Roadblock/LC7/MglB family)
MVFGSPKKHVANSIKKIKKGHGSQKVVRSLNKTLAEHPELMEDAVYQLVGIIQTDKVENFTYVIEVMLNIAEVEPDLLANSSDAIIRILEFPEDSLDINYILKTIDILGMIASRYPELMQPSVKIFLQKLNNPNSQIRSASFYILDLIAKPYPEYFLNYTLDLIRSLHGLHIDERLYATRLIGDIALISPDLIDESRGVLSDLAYKHPDTTVRQEAYDILKKFEVEDKVTTEEPEEEPLEFEKDFISLIDIKTESNDLGELADVLAESIKGIDFEESASEMLKSLGMDHLIVKPVDKVSEQEPMEQEEVVPEEEKADIETDILTAEDIVEPDPEETEYINKTQEEPILKKLPPKPVIENKKTPEHAMKRIERLVTDPNLITRLSDVKDIDEKKEEEAQESGISYMADAGEEKKKPDENIVDDITLDMINTIFEELSNEDWITNVGLVTKDGTLISASKPDSIDKTAFNKISNMLCFEETSTQKEGFRNRVSIELSDKLMVALSIDHEYILTVFTVPDVQFGIVLYQLNRTADKLEQILQ